jgi:Histidine kinase
MQSKVRNTVVFALGSVMFLALPLLLSPDFWEGRSPWPIVGFQREMALCALLLAFFHLHYFVLVPRLYHARRWVWYGLCVAACLTAVLVVAQLFSHSGPLGDHHFPLNRPGEMMVFPGSPAHKLGGPPFQEPPRHFFLLFELRFLIFAFVLFVLVLVFSLHLQASSRLRKLERERAVAEVAYLKAQINPHFLFNTLNSIYAMAIEGSESTADAVVKLAGMMRFVLQWGGEEYVSLEQELNYLSDYIDLQRLRLLDTVQLDFEVRGDAVGKKIAPLLLITFIENAFKHGLNPEEEARITVTIAVQGDHLEMRVANRKIKQAAPRVEAPGGLGIETATQRLGMQYAGRHDLKIEDLENEFRVWLKIQV